MSELSAETSPTNSHNNQTPPREGRVASILNERELVINIGSDQGVHRGMKFAVLAEEAITIEDPETKEVIGTIDREKVRVMATEVHGRMSVCKTYDYQLRGGGLAAFSAAEMFLPQTKVYETFRAPKQALPAPLSQEDSIVKIRDRVREVEFTE